MVDEAPQLTQDQLFSRFWASYPRKDAKKDARKVWGQIKPDTDLTQRILIALDWQKKLPQWTDNDGQYIPYAAKYLRGERWEDSPPASMQAPKEPWWDECQRLHGGTCEKALWHFQKKQAAAS